MRRAFLLFGVVAALLGAAPLAARAVQRDDDACALRPGARGLIRGDRVPSGCVLVLPEEREVERGVEASSVVLVPAFFLPRIVLLDPGLAAPTATGVDVPELAESLPRARLDQPFGPVLQPFRPVNRDFGRILHPLRPTNTEFGKTEAREPRRTGP